jgi:hypothetical protein
MNITAEYHKLLPSPVEPKKTQATDLFLKEATLTVCLRLNQLNNINLLNQYLHKSKDAYLNIMPAKPFEGTFALFSILPDIYFMDHAQKDELDRSIQLILKKYLESIKQLPTSSEYTHMSEHMKSVVLILEERLMRVMLMQQDMQQQRFKSIQKVSIKPVIKVELPEYDSDDSLPADQIAMLEQENNHLLEKYDSEFDSIRFSIL